MGVVGNRIFQQSAVGLVLFGVEVVPVFMLKCSNSSSSSSNNNSSSSSSNSQHKKP